MKKFKLIIVLAILLSAVSCTREETRLAVGDCGLKINFSTSAPKTRATTPGDGNVADGGGIYIDLTDPTAPVPDLVLLIADSGGSIVATYPDPVRGDAIDGTLEADPSSTSMSVTFTGLSQGNYTVYGFANTEGLWNMTSGGNTVTDLTTLPTAAAVEALQFSPLSAYTCPAVRNGRLPLSAKGSVSVSSLHTGEVTLEMIRCVAKVSAEFVNNTEIALTLSDYSSSFVGLCPNSAYVLRHDPDFPAGASSGNIVASEASLTIPASGSVTMTWYVFPSSGPYTLDVGFTMFKNTAQEHVYSYSDLPVHDDHARDLMALERNQNLHIVTRISKGTTVSFNFEVADWIPLTEQVLFD